MEIIVNFLLTIWELFLEMAPYLLLGFLIAGVLHVFIPKALFKKHLGKSNLASIIKAALFGIPLPLCSCGVIPTGISLRKNGASKGATNSFLISTPQTGVDSILITYSLMNIYWAIARPIIALLTAVFGGWLTDKVDKTEQVEIACTENTEFTKMSAFKKIRYVFSYAFIDFLSDISRPLIAGVILAAIITNLIPASLFENYLTSPLINMVIILIASIPLYVCATASVPIASALLLVGVSPGAVLIFLMAGPATNIATITVLWRSLGKKSTLAYLAAIIIGAFAFGITIDYILPSHLFSLLDTQSNAHVHLSENWLAISSTIILILLILFVEIKKLIPGKMTDLNKNQTHYLVEGMTCNHCKASVEKNIGNLKGITFSEVDLSSKKLTIEGDISETEIASKINDLGYTFKGKIED